MNSLVLVIQKLGRSISRLCTSVPGCSDLLRDSLVSASLVTSVASLLPQFQAQLDFETSKAATLSHPAFDNIIEQTICMVRMRTAAVVQSAGLTFLAAW